MEKIKIMRMVIVDAGLISVPLLLPLVYLEVIGGILLILSVVSIIFVLGFPEKIADVTDELYNKNWYFTYDIITDILFMILWTAVGFYWLVLVYFISKVLINTTR